MNHSLLNASPHTHVKIVVLALMGAILIVLGSITAHVNASGGVARLHAHAPVVKAGKPLNFTRKGDPVIR